MNKKHRTLLLVLCSAIVYLCHGAVIPDVYKVFPYQQKEDVLYQSLDNIQYILGISERKFGNSMKMIDDSNPDKESFISGFSKVIGKEINENITPYTYSYLSYAYNLCEATNDLSQNKIHPFDVFNFPTIDDTLMLYFNNRSASPSFNSMVSWLYAIILSELYPFERNELFKQAFTYGNGVIYGGYDWYTDVYYGKLTASIIYALMRQDEEVNEFIEKAKTELSSPDLVYNIPDYDELADGTTFMPGPPAEISPLFAIDIYEYMKSIVMDPSSDRAVMAVSDIDLYQVHQCEIYSEVTGLNLSKEATPEIYKLIKICIPPSSHVCNTTKNKYNRKRPYVYYGEHTLYHPDEEKYKDNGSYPSGHSSTAWGVGLVLAELMPEYYSEIMSRAYEMGQSRVIARYHWQSDVNDGRILGSTVISMLHNSKEFIEQFEKAKSEYRLITAVPHVMTYKKDSEYVYNLNGIRLSQPPSRGLYIKNDKKFLSR